MYFKYAMKRSVLQFVYEFLIVSLVWGSVWTIAGVKALPGGPIFNLFALYALAVILGRLVAIGNNVPPLIGMLLAGFILRNAFPAGFDISLSLPFYRFARGVVLIRAGLLLNANLLKNNIGQCLRLAVLPCLCEASVIAIGAFLFKIFPFKWGYLLGFAIASVSPAIIVPSFFKLKQNNYKLDKGIDTIVIAASTIENVLTIALFGIVLSLNYSTPQRITIWAVLEGPLEIFVGVSYGVLCGFILWFIPQENAHNVYKRHYSVKRFVIIVLFGAFASFGSGKAGFRFAGIFVLYFA
ncbi:mitochondrial sodium/hydrogen exchanger 9B2-like protein [Leptotrombidium deliense]|uniref:Mitochondrial sodium/hydrogen exchanger 9B2-like protein n=1 Tax=Leptotrombidium deliense TaxID=299467 RepID=A0A443S265_9ACAR|nr:mitochondrial sodium/hydrogen exchanger 9B2-like protein [Leptotrombidium deliense]